MEREVWLVLATLAVLLLYYLTTSRHRQGSAGRLPPGPRPLPVIGNALDLRGNLHHALARLARTHGPVMRLQLGAVPAVAISSAGAAREAFARHDRRLGGRHAVDAVRTLGWGDRSMIYLPSSDPLCMAGAARRPGRARLLPVQPRRGGRRPRARGATPRGPPPPPRARRRRAGGGGRRRGPVRMRHRPRVARLLLRRRGGGPGPGPGRRRLLRVRRQLGARDPGARRGHLGPDDQAQRLRPLAFPTAARPARAASRGGEALGGDLPHRGRHNRPPVGRGRLPDGAGQAQGLPPGAPGSHVHGPNRPRSRESHGVRALHNGERSHRDRCGVGDGRAAPQPKRHGQGARGDPWSARRQGDRRGGRRDEPAVPPGRGERRLHPGAPVLMPHKAVEDGVEVGGYAVPKGSMVFVNVWAIMRDPAAWDRPDEFVPERWFGERAAGVDFRGT